MPDRIAVTPEGLREISARMSTGAADVEAILSRLSRSVAPVRSEWVGAAKVHFNTLWDQLQKDASGLHSVLTGIAGLTDCAATAYEATEQTIADSFDGFRVRPAVESVGPSVPVDEAPVLGAVVGGLDRSDTVDGWPPSAVEQLVEQSQGEIDEITEQFNQIQEVLTTTVPESDSVEVLEATEVHDGQGEETGPSEGRSKGSARLPWTRFMTKAVQESKPREIKVEGKVRERRFKTSDPAMRPGTRLCRLCFTVVVIEPQYIETTETHTYLCCPYCGHSFPIRHSDSEALSTPPAPSS